MAHSAPRGGLPRWLLNALTALLMLGATAGAASPAHAQDLTAEQQKEILALLEAGNAAFDRGDYPGSLKLYEDAIAIADLPQIRYRMGLCQERLENYGEAIANYERYLELRPDADNRGRIETDIKRLKDKLADTQRASLEITTDPAGFEVRVKDAQGKRLGVTPLNLTVKPGDMPLYLTKQGFAPITTRATLEAGKAVVLNLKGQVQKPGRAFLKVSSTPADALVIDKNTGKPIGKTPLVQELPPGKLSLEVASKGYFPESRDIELDDGGMVEVSVTLTRNPSIPLDDDATASGPDTFGAGLGLTITGGVLAVGSGVMWYLASDRINQYNDLDRSDPNNTRADLDDLDGQIGTFKLLTYVTGGVAAASLVTGVILMAVDGGGESSEARADGPRLDITPLPGGAGVSLGGAF